MSKLPIPDKEKSSSLDWDSPSYKTGTVKRRPTSGVSDFSSGSENCAVTVGVVFNKSDLSSCGNFVQTSPLVYKNTSSVSKNLRLSNVINNNKEFKLTLSDLKQHNSTECNSASKSIENWCKQQLISKPLSAKNRAINVSGSKNSISCNSNDLVRHD